MPIGCAYLNLHYKNECAKLFAIAGLRKATSSAMLKTGCIYYGLGKAQQRKQYLSALSWRNVASIIKRTAETGKARRPHYALVVVVCAISIQGKRNSAWQHLSYLLPVYSN